MTLVNSLDQNFEFKNNLIVKIGAVYFGKYQPDSGLTIDSDKLIVTGANINPTQIDLKRATTQINSLDVTFIDGSPTDGNVFSDFMGADDNALIGLEVSVFFGRIDEAMAFSDYIEISTYIINDIEQKGASYKVKAKSQEDKTLEPVFQQQGTLDSSITGVATSVDVSSDEDIYPASGIILIDDEYMEYTSKVFLSGITTFTIFTRGDLSSIAEAHNAGAQVNYVEKLRGNPIELILQLLISSGGGGPYDLLSDGAGIDNTLVDVTRFEEIRDDFFPLDIFTLYPSSIDKMIKYVEEELLVPNNVRIIKNSMDNKISLAILDQSDLTATVPEIDDEITIKDSPKWKNSKNGLQTVVKVQWNWVEGLQKFTRSKEFKASTTILALYGEKKGQTLNFKGVHAADGGSSIVADRADRYLSRFGTPRATVKMSNFMQAFKHDIGDKIRVTAKNLPQQGAGLGMSSIVELVNRSVNLNTGIVSMGFRFTSYTNLRIGLISPSPYLDLTITDQKTFDVPDGTQYKAGYKLRLWNSLTQAYLPDAINEIQSISTNTITMVNNWTTTLLATHILFFADYTDSSDDQKTKYAYTVGPTDFFPDGIKGYQIIL